MAGRKLAGFVGREVSDKEAAKIGFVVHRTLGMSYGMAAATLVRAGVPPLVAGIAAGTVAFLVVDEGVVSTLFTPPPLAYPLQSHLLGAVGHLAYGVSAGAMLAAMRGLRVIRA